MNNNASEKLTNYIINKLINNNQILINKVIYNLGVERILLFHLQNPVLNDCYEDEREIFNEIMNNKNIIKEIKKNIHVKNNILYDLERINDEDANLEPEEYNIIKNRIINVDEFKNREI